MISIFSGRERSIIGERQTVFLKFDAAWREYIHLFNYKGNQNAWAIFCVIACHIDQNGWSYPGQELLMAQTGFSQRRTIGYNIAFLNSLVIPLPEGPQKLLNYYAGRQANGYPKSYYHIFPGAGNADLAPEPHIPKELKAPGLLRSPARGRARARGAQAKKTGTPSKDEGVSLLKPCAVERHMVERYIVGPHTKKNQSLNQKELKPRANARGERTNIMLKPIYLSVKPGLTRARQEALVYTCPHCTAKITIYCVVCPGCATEIKWSNNSLLARKLAREKELGPTLNTPVYTGAAAWLYLYAMAHPAGVQGERIFYRKDKGHDEAAAVNRYAALYSEQLVKDKAEYAASKKAVGRGLIVTTLNLLRAHNPTANVGSSGQARAPRKTVSSLEDLIAQADRQNADR